MKKLLDGSTQTLLAAYGRNYATATEMQKDFADGKDFVCIDPTSRYSGRYCSVRDFEPGVKVRARFGYNVHVTFLIVPKEVR